VCVMAVGLLLLFLLSDWSRRFYKHWTHTHTHTHTHNGVHTPQVCFSHFEVWGNAIPVSVSIVLSFTNSNLILFSNLSFTFF